MGNSKSRVHAYQTPSNSVDLDSVRAVVIRSLLPIYYLESNRCSPEELLIAKSNWTSILNNTAPHFLEMQLKQGPLVSSKSCVSIFFDLFYGRLFDIHPMCRPLFSSGLKSQGKFLVHMMSMTLTIADKEKEFNIAMIELAENHNRRGVKALEYGIIGEVLFWTLKKCLGAQYDYRTHHIWVKLFSRMLSVIVPHAVAFEIAAGRDQIDNLRHVQSSKGTSKSVSDKDDDKTFQARYQVFSQLEVEGIEVNISGFRVVVDMDNEHGRWDDDDSINWYHRVSRFLTSVFLMGNSSSDRQIHSMDGKEAHIKGTRANVAKLMLPVYYTHQSRCSREELALAKSKWTMILDNTSPFYLGIKEETQASSSCMTYFFDQFYNRLFDIHPMCKPLFSSGLKTQGKFLVQMMSMTLNLADKEVEFDEAMIRLAEVHNRRGVKALEYGIIGEVLFWTLRQCLGPEYDAATHTAWVKLFSRMLSVIVPHAVEFEATSGLAQVHRLREVQMTQPKDQIDQALETHASSDHHQTASEFFRSLGNLLGAKISE